MSEERTGVKIFHRENKLKMKAGGGSGDSPGFLDPNRVARGQFAIDEQEENYANEAEIVLLKIDSAWEDLKASETPEDEKKNHSNMYNYANNLKDIAKTFDYDLMSYFGDSLCNFCDQIDIRNEAHHVIVKAHIDVMWAAYKTNLKEEFGVEAEELKKMLNQAIEKHS